MGLMELHRDTLYTPESIADMSFFESVPQFLDRESPCFSHL